MRLTVNNIEAVKEMTKNDTTYEWFVIMKSGCVSDARTYYYATEKGHVDTNANFPVAELPKAIQKFIENKTKETWDSNEYKGDKFVTYRYM